MNTDVLKNISYGVYIVTSSDGKKPIGCVVNSIMQVTQDIVAVSINHKNYTNKSIKNFKKFAISILSTDVDDNIIPVFGFQTSETVDKFKDIETFEKEGIKLIKNQIGYLLCEVEQEIETSTHTVFLAKILDGDMVQEKEPMTYAYYHKVKKGLSPKTAPTYIEPKKEDGYKCKICGYIYKGDITKEPEDYVCPICKQPKSVFEKM